MLGIVTRFRVILSPQAKNLVCCAPLWRGAEILRSSG